ncbi:AAA family ATPase [Pseudoalteromonas rubra]|uniref:ORC1/DEAH AAA+ ATPase domain-containing protein n=1 Tax=Pseudoalteromonas rubra TaxID=43658 RepID=A0A0U2Z2E4_9GAMM|nr:AAA family ATPase [Pseudoalteromonas rubra]ALU41921.1 hypothetical protein AT705_02645 [Pseudoalteromonas rubra]
MKFTEHYSELQKLQTRIINNEIELFNIPPTEYCNGWALESVQAVLEGQSPVKPTKVIDSLWQRFFGEFDPQMFMADAPMSGAYTEDDKLILARIKRRMKERELEGQGVMSSTLATRINKSSGTISQLLNGKYAASPTKLLHEIWSILEPTDMEVQTGNKTPNSDVLANIRIRYGDVPYVQTSVPKLIKMACEHAQERRRIAVVSGQAGIGKSKGAEFYRDNNDHVLLIEGDEDTTSSQVLKTLADRLGISKAGGNSKLRDKIVDTLKGTNKIIILDEADKCKPNALDPLRTISDRAQIGVVLIGNIQLVDKLQSQERYELIASRVCFWPRAVGELPIEDIKTLFMELSQGALPLADDSEQFWKWLHSRVEGNARMLVENVMPHVISHIRKNPNKKVDKLMLNSVCATILNKQTI